MYCNDTAPDHVSVILAKGLRVQPMEERTQQVLRFLPETTAKTVPVFLRFLRPRLCGVVWRMAPKQKRGRKLDHESHWISCCCSATMSGACEATAFAFLRYKSLNDQKDASCKLLASLRAGSVMAIESIVKFMKD